MARPKLGENKKTNRVSVFYTNKEFAEIERKAAAAGADPAEFLRQASLGRQVKGSVIVPEINKDAARNLNDSLNSFNQFVRLIYAGRAEALPDYLLEELREDLKRTRELLLGRKWQ